MSVRPVCRSDVRKLGCCLNLRYNTSTLVPPLPPEHSDDRRLTRRCALMERHVPDQTLRVFRSAESADRLPIYLSLVTLRATADLGSS